MVFPYQFSSLAKDIIAGTVDLGLGTSKTSRLLPTALKHGFNGERFHDAEISWLNLPSISEPGTLCSPYSGHD